MRHEADSMSAAYMEDQSNSPAPQAEQAIFGQNEVNEGIISPEEIADLNNEGTVVASIDLPQRQGIFDRFKSFAGRKAVQIGVPATLMVASVAAACSGGSHHTEATPTFDPLNTATPTSTFETPTGTPTIENKVTPVSTNTPAPTETSTPTEAAATTETTSGEYANLNDFLENNKTITQEQKEAIQRELQGSTPFIFGDNFIIAIDNNLMTRGTTLNDDAGQPQGAAQLHSINVVPENITIDGKEYSSVEAIELMVDNAKYNAYKVKTGDTSLTFDEYRAKKDASFPLRAWDGIPNNNFANYLLENNPKSVVRSDTPTVIKFEADWTNDRIYTTTASRVSFILDNNVLVAGVSATNPGAVGNDFEKNGVDYNYQLFQPASLINQALASESFSIPPEKQNVPFVVSPSDFTNKLIPWANELNKFDITKTDNTGYPLDSIFRVTGTKWEKPNS